MSRHTQKAPDITNFNKVETMNQNPNFALFAGLMEAGSWRYFNPDTDTWIMENGSFNKDLPAILDVRTERQCFGDWCSML